jgi:hypothetical protein
MVGVALAALLLPTAYTMGPLVALITVAAFLYRLAAAAFGLVLYLSALLLSLIFPGAEEPEAPPPDVLPQPGAEPLPGATSLPWLEAIASALFWVLVTAIAVYAVSRFLRDRLGAIDVEESAGALSSRLLLWLRSIWRRWLIWGRGIQQRMPGPSRRELDMTTVGAALSGLFSLRRLPPRELIRYYYLSVVRRAGQAGLPRGRHQTPYEYQTDLEQHIPDLEPDLSGLTDAFVVARYSDHHLDKSDAETVKPLWQRVKTILRARRPRS